MLINSEQLIGLKVETKGGQYIGRVQSLDIDIEFQNIRHYHIKPSLLEGGIFSDELVIHHKQVITITEKKMVVVDNIVKYKTENNEQIFVGTQAEI